MIRCRKASGVLVALTVAVAPVLAPVSLAYDADIARPDDSAGLIWAADGIAAIVGVACTRLRNPWACGPAALWSAGRWIYNCIPSSLPDCYYRDANGTAKYMCAACRAGCSGS